MKVPIQSQLRACQLLGELLAAGFSLPQGLAYLGVALPKQKPAWTALQAALAAGSGFAEALAQAHFHAVIVLQVQLASVHGQLAESLQQAGAYLQLQVANRRRLQQLLIYPAVLMGLLVILQLVLWLAILPTLQMQPDPRWWVPLAVMAAVVLVSGIAALALRRRPTLRLQLSWWVPGIKGVVRGYYQYQFVVGASHFLGAGQGLSAYCQQLAKLPPGVLQGVGARVISRLATGAALGDAMAEPLIYAPAAELVQLGQPPELVQAGMALFAQSLFQALAARFERLLALIQPVLFLAIGAQIVWVYLQILGPLYHGIGSP
ncbi:type II secretion system F family protein [Lacticaseibacillus baoqingensis]|uniref:Type II secretion system F family protein n=1 Tax=Lacticaseibacillus baoqingensis TaxID=2486013 RepID=A0ABW4E3W7_9LACO|nr:type II secretion system F family protein [Lacticaseibacillus baoqingensis]